MRTEVVNSKPDEAQVDELLGFLSLSDPLRPVTGHRHVPLISYQEVEPLGLYEPFGNLEFVGIDGTRPEDVGSNLNISLLSLTEKNQVGKNGFGKITMHSFKTVSPNLLRGRLKTFLPRTVEISTCIIDQNAKYHQAQILFSWNGKKWVFNSNNMDGATATSLYPPMIHIATTLQFYRRYNWRVVLGHPGCASVSLVTTPKGAAEMFKLRDVPEGKTRRAALRNWITDHWRASRLSEVDQDIYIRKHLRGATDFSWKGLNVKLMPSQYDVEQNLRRLA